MPMALPLPPLLPIAGAGGRQQPVPLPPLPFAPPLMAMPPQQPQHHPQLQRPASASSASASAMAMPAAAPVVDVPLGGRIVVMDNGGNTCKIGLAGHAAPKLVPNCGTKPKREKRLFVGDQIDTLIDFTNLNYRRPMERGYVTNWELQTLVWDRCFTAKPNGLCVNTRDCSLLVTEPPFNLDGIRVKMDEIVFEKYGFQTYCRMQAAGLAARGVQREAGNERVAKPCGVVVDSGYSFSHVTPLFDGQPLNYAVKRVDVGGKLLTNLLKEVVSYRAFNVMDETHLLNAIKERLCYVSLDYTKDLAITKSLNPKRNPIKREYVFPNGTTRVVGYVKGEDEKDGTRKTQAGAGAAAASKPTAATAAAAAKPGSAAAAAAAAMEDDRRQTLAAAEEDDEAEEQVLVMNGERISVPEVLFHPSDIGMRQCGVAEAIAESIAAVPKALQPLMWSNVVLVGGNTVLPNYALRVEQELRALAPADFPVHVTASRDPVTACWRGAAHWAATEPDALLKHSVTKADWDELGPDLCRRMFYS